MSDIRIIQSDCLEAMRAMPEASVTAIVTDPPYSLGFMGRDWDKALPSVEVWRECLRVLRPGGHALIFGGTRTYHRLACAVEDAGFEVRDCLMWLYGQGFPKSLDVSKAIDKAAGAERSEGAREWSGGARSGGISHGGEQSGTAHRTIFDIPATDAARLWSGYGTALKPAWEPILLARKPLVGTVERNCREHGTGALNIDATRVPTFRGVSRTAQNVERQGRWPANLVLDEEAAALLDEQAPDKGQAAPLKTRNSNKMGRTAYGKFEGSEDADFTPHDALGGASRFFYCAKASKSDRGGAFNNHATVKPVELMRWLVRLVKGPGENLILDPFAGSGTTGVAAALEQVPCVLIEREAEYAEIIRRRLQEIP